MADLAKALRSSTYHVRSPSDLAELGKSTLDHFIEVQIYEDTHDVLRVKFRGAVRAAKAAKSEIELLQQVSSSVFVDIITEAPLFKITLSCFFIFFSMSNFFHGRRVGE